MGGMIIPEHRIPIGSRVRLRDGVDPEFYGGYSRVGNEGWIKKHKRDNFEYPLVLIEWDKDHWAYNGAPDIWTHEGHFETVEEPVSDKPKGIEEQLAELANSFAKGVTQIVQGHTEKDEPEKKPQEDEEEESNSYEETLAEARNSLKTAKAFIVLALHEKEADGEMPTIVYPIIFQHAKDQSSQLMLQHNLAHLSTMLYDGLISHTMDESRESGSDDEDQ